MAAPAQNQQQKPHIDPGGDCRRQRNADMQQRSHQQQIKPKIDGNAQGGNFYWSNSIFAREKPRAKHFDQYVGRQSDGIGGQCPSRRMGLGGAEGPTFEQYNDDAIGMTINAAAAGTVSSKANSIARFMLPIALSSSPARSWRDSKGNSAVPTATPITPSGNWFTRSE